MLLLLAVLCGLIEAYFTALEVALGAVSRARLRALADPDTPRGVDEEATPRVLVQRARAVLDLLDHPERLSILFLSVTSLSLWSAASLLTWQVLSGPWKVGHLLVSLLALLFVAEVIPLLLAARHAEAIALRCAGSVTLALRILRPFTWGMGAVAFGLARLLGSGPSPTPHVTEGELRTALATAEQEGTIEAGERALIEGAMDLRTQSVREVMTSLDDVVGVAANATLEKVLDLALEEGHSRLPVYEGTLNNIVGVLATKDLLPFLQSTLVSEKPKTARDVMRRPLFVSESGRVNVVLDELRRQQTLLAIVTDMNHMPVGLVTLEDLLEELVGEIQDEYDVEEAPVRLLNAEAVAAGAEPVLSCDANSSVRELGRFCSEELNLSTTLRDATGAPVGSGLSLAALTLDRLGRIPEVGDIADVGNAVAPLVSDSDAPRPSYEVYFVVAQMSGDAPREIHVQFMEEENEDEG